MQIIAIVGQPNVGKSSLFNRLCGHREAITFEKPGVTRDRHFGQAEWFSRQFFLVDTGGFVPTTGSKIGIDEMQDMINEQVEFAINEADLIIFLVDSLLGVTSLEEDITDILRRSGKPVFCVVNKVDNLSREDLATDFYSLGFEEVFPISVLHGSGIGDLMEKVTASLPSQPDEGSELTMRLCFMGKPNVGKSSLFNELLGDKRSIVHHVGGTTRDSILVPFEYRGENYQMIDTAGIRRWAKRSHQVEHYSVIRSFANLRKSDIAFLTLDASSGITQQDRVIASKVREHGCGVVFLYNKWDLIEKDSETIKKFMRDGREEFHFLDETPMITVSALKRTRLNKILDAMVRVKREGEQKIDPDILSEILRESLVLNPPSAKHMKNARIFGLYQRQIRGAHFVLKVSDTQAIHFSYQRYIKNQIKKNFSFFGWPVHLKVEARQSGSKKR